jgi:hypothetical protein
VIRTTRFGLFLLLLLLPLLGRAQTLVDIPKGPNVALPTDPLNEDKAVFNVSTFDYWRGRAVYFSAQNNRILVNFQRANGTWEFPTSQVAVELPEITTNPEITIALGVVLASGTADYKNAWDGQYYQRIMYFIHQSATTPNSAGRPCVAFSNDGVTWAKPAISVGPPGQAVTRCQNGQTSINLEAIAGYRGSGDQLVLVGLEGDFTLLKAHGFGSRTLTYAFTSNRNLPHEITKVGELPTAGMFAPAPAAIAATPDHYFRNLDFSYEPATGKAWIARATPYPYKYYTGTTPPPNAIPCSGVCPSGLATFPMRGQIYWMQTNGSVTALTTGTWTLARDFGRSSGWQAVTGGMCGPRYPLVSSLQTTFGVDMDSVNLHKKTDGTLARDGAGNSIVYVGGFPDRQQSCNTALSAGHTFLDGALYIATFPF